MEFYAIAHTESQETHGGLDTFYLIKLGHIVDHDFLGKHMSSMEMRERWVVAGIRTTVPLEWDQRWLLGSDFLHSPPFFLLMCTST